MTTDILGLSELAENQSAKYLTHNEALRQLEAMLIRVKSRTKGLSQITPAAGDVYIINDEYGERTPWAAGTAYTAGDIRVPTTHNGYRYKCTVAGTSGASEPTWPTTIGNTVVDGGVTWECEVGIWPTSTSYAPDYLAHYYSGAWHYHAPVEGMMLWCVDESADIAYSSSAWGAAPVASHNHDGVYEPASGDFTAKVSQATESLAGKAELATAAEAAAGSDTARIVIPARLAEVLALNKNPLAFAQGVHMTYASSGSRGIQVQDNDNIDFGTADFTLAWKGSLPSYPPSYSSKLMVKDASGQPAFYFNVETNGYLLFRIYSESGGVQSLYLTAQSTATVSDLLDGTAHSFAVSVVRETAAQDGSVTFFVDGLQLGDAVTIPAATPPTISGTPDLYISGGIANRSESICHFASAFNRALSAADHLALYRNGIDYADKWGNQTEFITGDSSDFEGNTVGSWAANGNGGAVSVNSTTPLSGSYDLAISNDSINNGGGLIEVGAMSQGKKYRLEFLYRADASWNVAIVDGSLPGNNKLLNIQALTGDGVEHGYAIEFDALISASTPKIILYVTTTNSEQIYIDNVQLKEIGATLALESEGINEDKWYDSSDNSLDAAYPSSGSSLVRKSKQDLTIEGTPQFAGAGIGKTHSGGSAKLEIKSGNNAYGLLVYASDDSELAGIYEHTSGYSQIIGKDAAGTIKNLIGAGGDSYLNGGKVGIGTSGPALKFHVLNNNAALAAGDNGTVLFEENQTGVPAAIIMQSVADNGGAGNQGAIYFDAGADGGSTNNLIAFNADHQTDNNYDMVITGGGKVGIGTDAPGATLEVAGNMIISGLKSGTSQANAGAAANELWIDTADNSIKIGV